MSGVLTSAVDLRTEYLQVNNAIETVCLKLKRGLGKQELYRIKEDKRVDRQVSHY